MAVYFVHKNIKYLSLSFLINPYVNKFYEQMFQII